MKFEIIPTKGILYDKCENVEQLYDNYYYPLLVEFKQLQQENKLLKDKYNLRERKWEKWNTEKSILSSKMSEYLCKYQNIKREYKNQNDCLCKYKAENNQLQEVIEEVRGYVKEHLTDNGRFLMLNEWQVPELLQILDKGSDK